MPNPGCKDEFRNCTELFMNCGEDAEFEKGCQKTCEKCPLPIAKSYELAIRRSSVDGCGNYNDDCANAFYVCGVSNEYEMLCPKTCELCYTKDILDVNRELEKCEIIYGKYFCNRLIITCAKSVDQNFGRDSSEPKSIRVAKCLAAEDVFLLCTARHDAEYCNKLLSACSQVTNTPIPYPLPGQPGQLPEAIEKCVSSEFSIALCYARNSPGVCQLWMKQCEIPSTNARLTHEQQQCMKNKDVVVVCKSKHSKMFCDKLGAACSQVTNTPIPEVGYGPEYMLPEAISLCIASEYYIAVCYVENGIQLCQLWMSYCYIYSIPTHLTPEQKNCMEEKKSLRLCYSRFGAQQCDRWSLLCKGVDSKGNMASSKAYKNCINSQVVLHKCKVKRGEIFCYKLEAACCAIFGVAVPSETVHILPQKVVNCIGSEDVVAVCRAEYDTAYCDKLIKACAELTGTSEQLTSSDSRHRLPHAVAIWNYIAFCYVRHGAQVCKDWMKVCKIQFWNGEITSAQKQCVENQNSIGHCYKDHGVEKCNRWTEMCKTLGLSTDPDSNDAYMICIDTQYPMAICGAKFDPELCNKLVVVCGQIFNVPIPEMTSISDYKLPTVIATCITTETYAAICYIRSGAEVCNRWMRACNIVITTGKLTIAQKQCVEEQGGALQTCISKHGVSFCYQLVITCSTMLGVTITGNRFEKIPRSILDCISTSDPLVLCKVKHGFDYCDRLRAACFEITGIQIQPGVLGNRLPDTVAKCISTEMFISTCITRYGADKCTTWSKVCNIVDFTGKVTLTMTDMDCMKTQWVTETCVSKYSQHFCTKLRASCSSLLGEPDGADTVTILSSKVLVCISTDTNELKRCISKYGSSYCYQLILYCSRTLRVTLPPGPLQNIPLAIANCIFTDDPMILCTVKYGADYCNSLQNACSEVTGVTIPFYTTATKLPDEIAQCIITENVIAVCYAEDGDALCKAWMSACKIAIPKWQLSPIEIKCIKNSEFSIVLSSIFLHCIDW
ncbi:unnamed protein product [Anisakis simplex]|uniref:ShKT domain-containing protein n=1 Tax=Anisakis simplex TaxID=6269 RepID=A0A0M3K266_ANISI|nr:unnamed protein product [Anisakis simplex]